MGFMGSNFFLLIIKDVILGFKFGESGSGFINFLMVWFMIVFMIWNFNCFIDLRLILISDVRLFFYFIWFLIIGFGIVIVRSIRLRKELVKLMDYYINLEVFEELEEVGGI